MKKWFILLVFVPISCMQTNVIPLSSEYKTQRDEIDVVSFSRDNPSFLLNDNIVDITKKQVNENADLAELETPGEKVMTVSDVLRRVDVNRYLMRSFIIYFRKKYKMVKIKPNLKVFNKKVVLVSSKKGSSNQIDRDFKPIRKLLNSHLILELRVLRRELTDYNPDGYIGIAFSDWYAVVRVKGFLYDLKRNKKVWESDAVEIWSNTESTVLKGLLSEKGKEIIINFKAACNKAAKILVDSFYEE